MTTNFAQWAETEMWNGIVSQATQAEGARQAAKQSEDSVQAAARAGDETCHVCEGTGYDAAFQTPCYRCDGTIQRKRNPAPACNDLQALAAWLGTQTWSEFAQSLASYYRRTGTLSPKQIASAQSMKAKCDAKTAQQAATQAAAPTEARPEISEGFYIAGTTAHKVTRSKAGHLYALPLNEITGKFEYETGAIHTVRTQGTRITLTEAATYAKRTGRCCCCGRHLTNTNSIEAGIGPICASKL